MSDFVARVSIDPGTVPTLIREGSRFRYRNDRTGVTAELRDDGTLRIPVPHPSFWRLELGPVFALLPDQLEALAAASAEAARGADPGRPRLEPDRGEAWWRYVGASGLLRLAWPSADVLIPDLVLWRRRDGHEVSRVLIWSDDQSALVVPTATDQVIVRPAALSAVRPSGPPGVVPIAGFLEAAGDRVLRFEVPVPHWLYRGGAMHRRVLARLAELGTPARQLAPVAPGALIDA